MQTRLRFRNARHRALRSGCFTVALAGSIALGSSAHGASSHETSSQHQASSLELSSKAYGRERSPAPSCGSKRSQDAGACTAAAGNLQAAAPIAWLVPGLLLHGSAAYAAGRHQVATDLMWLEGSSLALTFGGFAGLALTGASRITAAPFILSAAGGVTLFASSLLLDGYAALGPEMGWGTGAPLVPLWTAELGYIWLNNPVLSLEHLAEERLEMFLNRTRLALALRQAPSAPYVDYRAEVGYRPWGQAAVDPDVRDGSFWELWSAGGVQAFPELGFHTHSVEVGTSLRLGTERLSPSLRGAFLEWQAGVAARSTSFDSGARLVDTVLLARHELGWYFGRRMRNRSAGEASLYYDHRHDDLAAGLKVPGLGSGTAGHFGLQGAWWLQSGVGAQLWTEVGASWLLGARLHFQYWRKERLP